MLSCSKRCRNAIATEISKPYMCASNQNRNARTPKTRSSTALFALKKTSMTISLSQYLANFRHSQRTGKTSFQMLLHLSQLLKLHTKNYGLWLYISRKQWCNQVSQFPSQSSGSQLTSTNLKLLTMILWLLITVRLNNTNPKLIY